jgi:molybdopterin-guanine dinucleotide biosynthesis protein MobB
MGVRIAAFTGHSGAGKTTAVESLIRHFVGEGLTVGALKHTHHPLNEDTGRGDTGRFRRAGADPVLLAGDGEAVVFSSRGIGRVRFDAVTDLLETFRTDILLVEGFKSVAEWPRIELNERDRRTTDELLTILDRIWRT